MITSLSDLEVLRDTVKKMVFDIDIKKYGISAEDSSILCDSYGFIDSVYMWVSNDKKSKKYNLESLNDKIDRLIPVINRYLNHVSPETKNNEPKKFHYEILSSCKHDDGMVTITFKDGGACLVSSDSIQKLIDTTQCEQFYFDFRNCVDIDKFMSEVQSIGKKLNISNVELKDISEFSFYKEYILSNGWNIKVNSIGILVDDMDYYEFQEFMDSHSDKLSEDALFEFNKYTVKQDTGTKNINPFNLSVNDINFDDIITAISGINRFAGQTKALHDDLDNDFYTVGQHTLAMHDAIIYSPDSIGIGHLSKEECVDMAKIALVHEAFEGITGTDLITPFKYATAKNEYKVAEAEAERVIEKALGFPLMTSELKKIDKMMAATEGYYLLGQSNTDWKNYAQVLDKKVLCIGLAQEEVKERLTILYEEYGLNEKLEDYRFKFNKAIEQDKIFEAKMNEYTETLKGFDINQDTYMALCHVKAKSGIVKIGNQAIIGLDSGKHLLMQRSGGLLVGGANYLYDSIDTASTHHDIKSDIEALSTLDYNQKEKCLLETENRIKDYCDSKSQEQYIVA